MTGKKISCIIILCIFYIAFVSVITPPAGAVGVTVSAAGSVTAGNPVNVTVTFTGERIFGVEATFSFDSSILRFTSGSGASNGRIVLAGSNPEGHASLSTTLSFDAIAEGAATVSINCISSYDVDLVPLGTGSNSITINITSQQPDTPPPAPSPPPPTPARTPSPQTPTPAPTPPVPDREIAYRLGEETLYVWHTMPRRTSLPEGFAMSTVVYDGLEIDCALHSGLDIILLYVTDENAENAQFLYYDINQNRLFPYIFHTAPGGFIIYPAAPADVPPPYGNYTDAVIIIDDGQIVCLQDPDGEPYLYLLYASYMNNSPGWYLYDSGQGSVQRYTPRVIELTPQTAPSQAPTPAPPTVQTQPPPGSAPPVDDAQPNPQAPQVQNVIISLILLIIVLSIALISLAVSRYALAKKSLLPAAAAEDSSENSKEPCINSDDETNGDEKNT